MQNKQLFNWIKLNAFIITAQGMRDVKNGKTHLISRDETKRLYKQTDNWAKKEKKSAARFRKHTIYTMIHKSQKLNLAFV